MSFALRNFLFWGLPTLYSLMVMALYFSGSQALVDWVAPRTMTEPWSVSGDRELGLLENGQNLLLLGCIAVLLGFVPKAEHVLQRIGAGMALAALTFMLLEEISYGAHYWDFMTGAERFEGDTNFHNTSGYTNRMKQIVDVGMVLWFVFLPLLVPLTQSKWLRYFAAPRMIILTIIAALLISKLAHYLDDEGLAVRAALSNNISEFRELFTYYVWLLYCWIMVHRPWPGGTKAAGL